MLIVRSLRLRKLSLFALLCLGSAFVWSGTYSRRARQPAAIVHAPAAAPPAVAADDDSSIRFRLARDTELSRQQESLMSLMESTQAGEEVRTEAERALWRLTRVLAAEHEAEATLAMQGWNDASVTVIGDEATVVVHERLTEAEAAAIGRLVAKATNLDEASVKILERP